MLTSSQMAETISAVVVALNEGEMLRRTVQNLVATLPRNSEIVVVDDGSTDDSTAFLQTCKGKRIRLVRSNRLGSALARNFGAALARGDCLIFCDAHVSMQPGWWKPLMRLLRDPQVGASAPAVYDMNAPRRKGFGQFLGGPHLDIKWFPQKSDEAHEVPILPGCCLAIRRKVFRRVGGFDAGIIRWGCEDIELSLRLWRLGYRLLLEPNVAAAHLFRSRPPYPIDAVNVLHNKIRMAAVHFQEPRLARVVDELRQQPSFPAAISLVLGDNVAARRAQVDARAKHNAEWFFQKFEQGW
jgi:GT2 family glycosyltransferase